MEREFIKHYSRTVDARYAAEKAGYAHPAVQGPALARRPAVIEAARTRAAEDLANLIIPLAVSRHLETLQKAPIGQALNGAIKLAYQYGLGENAQKVSKEPHEMTGEELAEAIATLKRAAADKAKPVIEHVPADSASVFD